MAWQLSRAVLRCQARRGVRGFRSAPLLAVLVVAAVVAAPVVAWRTGHSLGTVLVPVLRDAEGARLLALGPALAGATAGAALAVTTSVRRSLGSQLQALPLAARASLTATVLVPASVALALALPPMLALAIPVGLASPGGAAAGIGLVAAGVAGAAVGAVACECALQGWTGSWRLGLLASLSLATAWIGSGELLGSAAAGPLALVGTSLTGATDAKVGLAGAVVTTLVAGAAWLELAARRPERVSTARASARRRVVGPLVTAVPLATLMMLTRRRDLRFAVLVGVGFGSGGVVLADRADIPPPGPLQLGASSAALGAVLAPLAVGGIVGLGRWAWACAPRVRLLPAAALFAAALVVLFAALVPVIAVAALVSGAPAQALGEVILVVLGMGSAAALAGSVVPWRGATMGDQVASFAAFAGSAGLLSAIAGFTGPRLVAAGAPDELAAGAITALFVGVALAAVVRRLHGQGAA